MTVTSFDPRPFQQAQGVNPPEHVYRVDNVISYRLWWDELRYQVYFQVTHQDERVTNRNRNSINDEGNLKYVSVDSISDGMYIGTWSYPDIAGHHVALRGCSQELDDHVRGRYFAGNRTADAHQYIQLVHELIQLWAMSKPVQSALGRSRVVETEQLGLFDI